MKKHKNIQSIPKKSKLGKTFVPDSKNTLICDSPCEISPQEHISFLQKDKEHLQRKVERLGEAGHMILRGIGTILNRYED
jgi:hypothetical protein